MSAQDDDEHHFLKAPEVVETSQLLFTELLSESDRGAIIIAADVIDAHLDAFLREIAPASLTKNNLDAILEHPGPLKTFSAKADVMHLMGLIPTQAHRAITLLRRIRNDGAHTQKSFALSDHKQRFDEMLEVLGGADDVIHNLAVESVMTDVIYKAIEIEMTDADGAFHKPFSTRADFLIYLQQNPHLLVELERRVPKMSLALAMHLLTGLIVFHRKRIASSTADEAISPIKSNGE